MVGKYPLSSESILAANDRAVNSLRRAIVLSQGQFSLVLVGCNYEVLRDTMLQRLEAAISESYPIKKVALSSNAISLYSTIHNEIGNSQPSALMILGLESVEELDDLLRTINHIRDEFRKRHPFPMVFWVSDELLRKLRRFAPDFTSWAATPIRFEMTTQQLRYFLQEKTDSLFGKILDSSNVQPGKNPHTTLGQVWDYSSYEFRCAIKELKHRGIDLEPELDASLAFVSGLDDYASDRIDTAIEHFLVSFEFWESQEGISSSVPFSPNSPFPPTPPSPHLLRQGASLFYLGLCYFRLAERSHLEHRQRWQQSKYYLKHCLSVFEEAHRQDLMGQITCLLGEVLQHLREWDELQQIANKSQELHNNYGTPFQLACDFGFLAQVAIAQQHYSQASQLSRVALWQLYEAKENKYLQPNLFPLLMGQIYRLTLAKALLCLGEQKIAREQLELASKELDAALNDSDFRYDVYRYIRILRWLRSLYFDSGQYLEAFTIRQKRRSVEQQYGLRAFIGAGRLQPQRHPTTPVVSTPSPGGTVALEITASGRQRDVQNLIARISRPDHKLTIIHGPSGVGKSSTVTAGLVPALQQRAIGDQIALPVVLQVYTDWVRDLGKALGDAIISTKPAAIRKAALETHLPPYPATPITINGVLEQLQENAQNHIITVLIFDQVEEFFSGCNSLNQQREFDDFLCNCLNISFVKVILTLREDYLHRLLEFKHLLSLETINYNILDKNIRYQLNNFSRDDARTVIQELTQRSQYNIESTLIDALVDDLSAELGEVRPIELQVVGAQLQDERILSLAKYEQFRPNKLIERYLKELIRDCGKENERAALIVLYLLTDENKKRPFKTRAQLATEMAELEDVEKLELVLEILVHSGLVVLFPEVPERYQLIHDYLVDLIRVLQQDELSLQEQVKQLRQIVQESECEIARLNSELRNNKQQSKHQENQPPISSGLFGELKELRKRDELSRVERDRLLAEIEQQKLQAELIETEKQRTNQARVNRILKNALAASGLGMLVLVASIGMAFYQGRKAVIAASVAASASSEALFSLGKDIDALREGLRAARKLDQALLPDAQTQQVVRTALYQATYGMGVREINRLEDHKADVNGVAFSSDNSLIASASSDGTIKLWQVNGKKLTTLKGHGRRVNSVAFSPDSKTIISGSSDGTVRLWNSEGKELQIFKANQEVVNSVAFSPDGTIIASGSADNTLRLWNSEGKAVVLTGHTGAIKSIAWSPDGNVIASGSSDMTIRLWNREGKLLKIIPSSGDGNVIFAVAWSPDGTMLVSAGADKQIRLWSRDGKLLKVLSSPQGHRDVVADVGFSPDGKTIASASWDKTVKLWNLNGELLETLKGHNDYVNGVSFSRDGQTLASASRDTDIKLWRWKYMPLRSIVAHSKGVSKLNYSPKGDLLATASEDGMVKTWTADGRSVAILTGHSGAIWDVSFSRDAQIATASDDGSLKLWNRDGKLLASLLGHEGFVLTVDWSPNGQLLASGGKDKSVRLWNRDGKVLHVLTGHTDLVNWVSFSPDGEYIASASDDNTVKIWSKDGRLVKTLTGHNRSVYSVAWSNDGKTLATASLDSTARLWNLEGKLLKVLHGEGESFISINFSPDNNTIATLSTDKVKLWNRDGKLELVISAEDEEFSSLTFTPDSKTLVTGSSSGKMIFRDLADTKVEKILDKGCDLLQDYLQNNTNVMQSDRVLCPGK